MSFVKSTATFAAGGSFDSICEVSAPDANGALLSANNPTAAVEIHRDRTAAGVMAAIRIAMKSGNKLVHNHSAHVRQTKIAALIAISQVLMIDPEQVQHGRLHIVDMHRILRHVVTQIVGLTDR